MTATLTGVNRSPQLRNWLDRVGANPNWFRWPRMAKECFCLRGCVGYIKPPIPMFQFIKKKPLALFVADLSYL